MGFFARQKNSDTGMISERSIAYGIIKPAANKAELAFTYVVDKLEERVRKMAAELGSELVFRCDVASDDEINQVFVDLGKHWDGLDGLVHSIGFAPQRSFEAATSSTASAAKRSTPLTKSPHTACLRWQSRPSDDARTQRRNRCAELLGRRSCHS